MSDLAPCSIRQSGNVRSGLSGRMQLADYRLLFVSNSQHHSVAGIQQCAQVLISSVRHTRSILGVLRVYTLVLQVAVTTKHSTAHIIMVIIYPQYITPEYCQYWKYPLKFTASTGSTWSIEPRNTRSSSSINVQNPNYCECTTRSMDSIERWHTASSTRSMSSIGPGNTVGHHSQCLQYCPPKISYWMRSSHDMTHDSYCCNRVSKNATTYPISKGVRPMQMETLCSEVFFPNYLII